MTYPSFERLFEGEDRSALESMRERLRKTHRDLEQIIRRGTHAEAASAARVVRAYDLTLKLLAELEEER